MAIQFRPHRLLCLYGKAKKVAGGNTVPAAALALPVWKSLESRGWQYSSGRNACYACIEKPRMSRVAIQFRTQRLLCLYGKAE